MNRIVYYCLLLLLTNGNLRAQSDSVEKSRSLLSVSPSWFDDKFSELGSLTELEQRAPDTALINRRLLVLNERISLLHQELTSVPEGLSIRYLTDLKTEIRDLRRRFERWKRPIGIYNEALVRKSIELNQAKRAVIDLPNGPDSTVIELYNRESAFLLARLQEGLTYISSHINLYTGYEERMMLASNELVHLQSKVGRLLSRNEKLLLKREFPVLWQTTPADYKYNLATTVLNSLERAYKTFTLYAESSLAKIIIFRAIIYLLCLLPLFLFHKQQFRHESFNRLKLHYFDRYPFRVSLILGLSFTPLIFVNAPRSFMEIIFLWLTITVASFVIKRYPGVNRKLFLSIIIPYLILFLLNFFVTPTFAGRLIFSLSIFLVIPMALFLKRLPTLETRHKTYVRFLIIFLILHITVGWVLVVAGRYTLGKSVILAAYNLLILSMILRIAALTFLDYLQITAHLINEKSKTIHINYPELAKAMQPYIYIVILLLLSLNYLANLNILEFISEGVMRTIEQPRYINNIEYSYGGILLFLGSVYAAFLLSHLLRSAFDQTNVQSISEKRSKFGSYVLLFRMLLITAGFVLAVMVSGIPVNSFTIIFGALSVGIGFGLQNIVANIISGVMIAFERPFVLGDVIEYEQDAGRVKEIGLRATRIATSDGADLIVPNGNLLSKRLKNWTYTNNRRTIDLNIPFDHSEEPASIQEAIKETIAAQPGISDGKVLLHDINEYATVYRVILMVENISDVLKIRGDFMAHLHRTIKAKNIKFAERGGER